MKAKTLMDVRKRQFSALTTDRRIVEKLACDDARRLFTPDKAVMFFLSSPHVKGRRCTMVSFGVASDVVILERSQNCIIASYIDGGPALQTELVMTLFCLGSPLNTPIVYR